MFLEGSLSKQAIRYQLSSSRGSHVSKEPCGMSWSRSRVTNMAKAPTILVFVCLIEFVVKCSGILDPVSARAAVKNWINRPGSDDVYWFYDLRASTWEGAKTWCQTYGGELLVITSEEERNWIAAQVARKAPKRWWIGLADWEREAYFKWIDGSEVDKDITPWNKGEPNNGGDRCGEYCVNNEAFSDQNCNKLRCYICRDDSATSSPKVYTSPTIWNNAYLSCIENGEMQLFWVRNNQDMELLKKATQNVEGCKTFWVGLKNTGTRTWKWSKLQELMDTEITPWVEGDPENISEEDCVVIKKNGYLNDYSCFKEAPYICKRSGLVSTDGIAYDASARPGDTNSMRITVELPPQGTQIVVTPVQESAKNGGDKSSEEVLEGKTNSVSSNSTVVIGGSLAVVFFLVTIAAAVYRCTRKERTTTSATSRVHPTPPDRPLLSRNSTDSSIQPEDDPKEPVKSNK